MIDEKKLIEDIDNCVAGLTNIQIMQIADIIEAQPKVAEWIPCSERLPETDGWYFTAVVNGIEKRTGMGLYKQGVWIHLCDAIKTVAWQPLPPAYKGE